MTARAGWREIDAKAHEAQVRFYNRTGWEPVDVAMPFDALLAAEEDGAERDEKYQLDDYDIRQRAAGVKAFFRHLTAKGLHPATMLKQLAAVARAMSIPPFAELTMHEVAMLFSETPAAHSWRCKALSREIELGGMKGSRLPGQKSKAASESYRECRKGNNNRKGGAKAARQASFLRKLNVKKHPTSNDHE